MQYNVVYSSASPMALYIYTHTMNIHTFIQIRSINNKDQWTSFRGLTIAVIFISMYYMRECMD